MELSQRHTRGHSTALILVGCFLASFTLEVDSCEAAEPIWRQVSRIVPEADPIFSEFGAAVTYAGDTPVIGATFSLIRDLGSPSVAEFTRIYTTAPANGLVEELVPSSSLPSRGKSAASYGSIAVVGAAGGWTNQSGSAWVYNVETGEELAILTHTGDLAPGGSYADDVAIHGDTVAIGNVKSHSSGGYVDLFSLAGESWTRRLEAPEGMPSGWFGTSVELTADRLFVGAALGRGRVYTYDSTSGAFLAEITAPVTNSSYFGFSMSADDGRILVGSPRRGISDFPDVSGWAYLFDAASGELLQTFRPDDGDGEDEKRFGRSVALYGDLALVGAPNDSQLADFSGAAYLFDVTTGDQIAKLLPSNPTQGGLFGWSVDLNGTNALVGAPLNSGRDGLGVAYEFQLALPGDYDGDGEVTLADGEVWNDRFGTQWGDLSADGNADGIVDAADYTIWRDAYIASNFTQPVPEPQAWITLVCGTLSLLARRRSN